MSLDTTTAPDLFADSFAEARRQIEICNACRYCEGFCSVFPAMTRERSFADADLTHLANLCHNCRGCYYACQYTEPHEFALNIPAALAEVRQDSWERMIAPQAVARLFHAHGVALAGAMVVAISLMILLAGRAGAAAGAGFYAYVPHNLMVAIFAPAFLGPLVVVALALRRYWRETAQVSMRFSDVTEAIGSVARMRNLAGGHGEGCNFEKEDRFSNARRYAHQAMMYGFLLCFAATASGTLMHYLLDWPAPYGLLSPPKLLGVPGGILMVLGGGKLAWLKWRAPRDLSAARVWSGEMAFILLLIFVALSGLALYAASGTAFVKEWLALHLGAVLTLFILLPYSKMVHGFFRLTALIADAAIARSRRDQA